MGTNVPGSAAEEPLHGVEEAPGRLGLALALLGARHTGHDLVDVLAAPAPAALAASVALSRTAHEVLLLGFG
jgi:hypothetical protein